MAEPRPVVLATGGTGGHVFPAEALAGELEARGVPFALVTDARGRQWQGALARRPIHYIHSASPTGSLQRRLLALLSLGLGLVDAWRALGRIDPSAVVGFGGYASVPTMIAARLRRLPAMLHEQNAVLGKANRLVLGGAARVGTSFVETSGLKNDDRARLVGNPVREPVRLLRNSPYRAPTADRVIDVLVFAGSQGAASFSKVIPAAILSLPHSVQIWPDSRGSRGEPPMCMLSLRNSIVAMLSRIANSWTTSVRSSLALPSVGYSSQNGLLGALLSPIVWIRSVSSKLRR